MPAQQLLSAAVNPAAKGRLDALAAAFAPFTEERRWLAWRQEVRGSAKARPTKLPYDPTRPGREWGWASSTDPATWGTRAQAERRAKELNGDGRVSGIGITLGPLGDLGNGAFLAGVDLDGSIANGVLADWAASVLTVLQSYAEISPSGNGIKSFFMIHEERVRPFLDLIGVAATAWGCKRGIPGRNGSNHGPAIELYCADRYFTVTERLWSIEHPLPALLRWAQLQALAALVPPAPPQWSPMTTGGTIRAANGSGAPKPGNVPGRGGDNSRSARAVRAALQRQPDSFAEMTAHLRNADDAGVRDWAAEVDDRQLERLWQRFCAATAAQRAAALADFDKRIGAGQ
jgi:putative DNA primase/helicase